MELIFLRPSYLAILFAVPILIFLHFFMQRFSRRKTIPFANFEVMKRVSKKYSLTNTSPLLVLRIIIIVLLSLVISEARLVYEGESDSSNFVISIDTSLSMMADDFTPSRLEFAKKAAVQLVNGLEENNKVALISFSDVSLVRSILTDDKEYILRSIEDIEEINNEGTDLGETIFSAVNLMLTDHNPRNIILLTDGQSNMGVKMTKAIEYAIQNNVKIYTLGIGKDEGGSIPHLNLTFYLNQKLLSDISTYTGGKFYNVQSSADVQDLKAELLSPKYQKIELNLNRILLGVVILSLFFEFAIIKIIYKIVP